MHIKHIHSMIEKLSECADAELAKGTDKVDTEEMEKVICMIDKLAEAEYYAQVTKAMDEAKEEAELMAKLGYPDDEVRYYRGQPRNKEGQFKADGRPNAEPRRRGYDPIVNPTMTTMDMYGTMPSQMPKEFRNADMGGSEAEMRGYRRGYEEGRSANGGNGGMRDSKEGRFGMARKRYMETKEVHPTAAPDDKQAKLKDLDVALTEFGADIKEMLMDMTPEEKTMAKTKLQNIMTAM